MEKEEEEEEEEEKIDSKERGGGIMSPKWTSILSFGGTRKGGRVSHPGASDFASFDENSSSHAGSMYDDITARR